MDFRERLKKRTGDLFNKEFEINFKKGWMLPDVVVDNSEIKDIFLIGADSSSNRDIATIYIMYKIIAFDDYLLPSDRPFQILFDYIKESLIYCDVDDCGSIFILPDKSTKNLKPAEFVYKCSSVRTISEQFNKIENYFFEEE